MTRPVHITAETAAVLRDLGTYLAAKGDFYRASHCQAVALEYETANDPVPDMVAGLFSRRVDTVERAFVVHEGGAA
jgi:hypothetical protein